MNPNTRGRRVLARDKHLLSLQRELYKLNDIQRSAPLIELDEPYQRGWVRYFRLRDDALRRKDAPALNEVLKKVNHYEYCRTGRFSMWLLARRRERLLMHLPRFYTTAEWRRELSDAWRERYGKYFEFGLVQLMNSRGEFINKHLFSFKFPHYLVTQVEKHFVTHARVRLADVDARIQEIENYLEQRNGWARLHNLHGIDHNNKWWMWDIRSRKTVEHTALQFELEELHHGND